MHRFYSFNMQAYRAKKEKEQLNYSTNIDKQNINLCKRRTHVIFLKRLGCSVFLLQEPFTSLVTQIRPERRCELYTNQSKVLFVDNRIFVWQSKKTSTITYSELTFRVMKFSLGLIIFTILIAVQFFSPPLNMNLLFNVMNVECP